MAPHINFFFKRSDRAALAAILDRYTQMMAFFDGGPINIQCVDHTDPLYHTWKIAEWSKVKSERKVKISNEQLHQSFLNADHRVKHIYAHSQLIFLAPLKIREWHILQCCQSV